MDICMDQMQQTPKRQALPCQFFFLGSAASSETATNTSTQSNFTPQLSPRNS
jgi:hypothetical protein